MTLVDAHIHLWDLSRFSLSWFRDDMGLPRVASPADFRSATTSVVERAKRDETPHPDLTTDPDAGVAADTLRLAGARSATRHSSSSRSLSEASRNPGMPSSRSLSEGGTTETKRNPGIPSRHVASAIAVQAGDTLPEMQWLREVAATDPVVRSVVLQYVPAPDGWAGLATAVLNDRVRGIRVATPGGAADLSDVPALDALCEGAEASGRVVEFLVRPAQLDAVAHVAARHPHTRFVLCHLGLGAGDPTPAWEQSLRRVAAEPRTTAKFSGLLTGVDDHGRLAALATTASTVFGVDRLMFGSDWPMSARIESHEQLIDEVAVAWGARPDAFWGSTATEVYGL